MTSESTITCDNCGREGALAEVVFLAHSPGNRKVGKWRSLCAECLADVQARCGIR